MQFGMFLCKKGAITPEQFIAALERQHEETVPLGQIALEEGKLEVRDLLSVLRVQNDLPQDRFGDLAVELGKLTRRDVAELLMLQSDRRPSFGDCLVELGILTREQLLEELAAYRRAKERRGAARTERITSQIPAEQLAAAKDERADAYDVSPQL